MPTEATLDERSGLRVVLVSMPFMDPHRPSIQLGLLKSLAAASGFPVRTLHANLDFAVRIGWTTTSSYASIVVPWSATGYSPLGLPGHRAGSGRAYARGPRGRAVLSRRI